MLTANMLLHGDDQQDQPKKIEAPVIKRSPEVYRGLPWGRDLPVAHDDPASTLVPPVVQSEPPRAQARASWSPLHRTLLVAAIMLFVGLETRLFLAGTLAPATMADQVELVPFASAAMSAQSATPTSIELIYDASGSMLAPVDGSGAQRWDVARTGLQAWLNSGALALDTSFGMQSYGQQSDGACGLDGSALALAPYSFERAYNGIADTAPAAGGRASIAASLRAASTSLRSTQGPATIVLVASGVEACGGNPTAEAAAFAGSQARRQIHVIGVAVQDPEARAQLRAIAEQGNGNYIAVSNSDELAAALQQVTAAR